MITAIVVLFQLLGFFSSIHAVMTARTAQGAIAWGVSLNTFPYVAVPAYWVLGRRNFEGYVEAFNDRQAEVEQARTTMHERLEPFAVETLERIPNYEAMKRLAQTPFLRGNDVTLLVDGDATFDSIFAGLARAEHYALVQFYIIHDDGLGRRLKSALIDCANRGVKVFVLYDEVGSMGIPKSYLAELETAGIQQSKFNTTQGAQNRFQLNFRNHRRTWSWTGEWRGSAATTLATSTSVSTPRSGTGATPTPSRGRRPRSRRPCSSSTGTGRSAPSPTSTGSHRLVTGADVKTMVLAISPTDDIETAQLFFVHALNAARDRIWIATPYFVPDEAVMAALRLAALRGVDVRIIVPEKGDNPLVDLATPGPPASWPIWGSPFCATPTVSRTRRCFWWTTTYRRWEAPTSTTGPSGCSSRSTPSWSTRNSGGSSRRCSKTTWRTPFPGTRPTSMTRRSPGDSRCRWRGSPHQCCKVPPGKLDLTVWGVER